MGYNISHHVQAEGGAQREEETRRERPYARLPSRGPPSMKPSCLSFDSSSSVCILVSLMRRVEKTPVNIQKAKISSLRHLSSVRCLYGTKHQ